MPIERRTKLLKEVVFGFVALILMVCLACLLINYFLFPNLSLNGGTYIRIPYGEHFDNFGCSASYLGDDISDSIEYDGEVDETVLLASLPTSKDHIPSDVEVSSGCLEISERMVNAYVFMAKDIVTDNGFFFEKNTFIYGQNIKMYKTTAFLQQQIDGQIQISVKGKLTDDIFSALTDCLKNSGAVRKRYKHYL